MRLEKVMTAEEAAANSSGSAVWRAGTYDFEIHDASEEISKASGNEQIKLTVWVYDAQGDRKTVFDYLGATEKVQWKTRQFATSVGLVAQYESGELDVNDIVERTGKLKLGVQKSPEYGDQNKVIAYLEAEAAPARAARPAAARPVNSAPARQPAPARSSQRNDELSDDIPF